MTSFFEKTFNDQLAYIW